MTVHKDEGSKSGKRKPAGHCVSFRCKDEKDQPEQAGSYRSRKTTEKKNENGNHDYDRHLGASADGNGRVTSESFFRRRVFLCRRLSLRLLSRIFQLWTSSPSTAAARPLLLRTGQMGTSHRVHHDHLYLCCSAAPPSKGLVSPSKAAPLLSAASPLPSSYPPRGARSLVSRSSALTTA